MRLLRLLIVAAIVSFVHSWLLKNGLSMRATPSKAWASQWQSRSRPRSPSLQAMQTQPLIPRLSPVMMSTVAAAAVDAEPEKYAFESNVARVMDIIINSLYSNKDVFLRELVSNAADACDKKRILALIESRPQESLGIRVLPDREANTLTIEDRGIGMNKEDLIQNLGRIAESGTKKFMDTVGKSGKNKEDAANLIGQFGVGFYSAFLVAKKITVVTRGTKGEVWRWEAKAESLDQYTITRDTTTEMPTTGTRIVLSLKDENDQYLDEVALKALLEKYSEFISFPIELQRTVTKPHSEPDPAAEKQADGTQPTKTVMKKTKEWFVVNEKKPLWLRSPKDCEPAEYEDFYRQTFKAHDQLMGYSHFSVEGNVDFKAMLFLPTEVPYELSRDMFAPTARSMRLYVRRVFINDNFQDLIPRWLLFLRGVVDSDDLPLNVGREILQQSRALRIIKQRLVKKALTMISNLAANRPEQFDLFWKNFGKYLKVGAIEDEQYREDLLPLLRFHSTHATSAPTSLVDYVKRMPEEQKSIYYVVGETRSQAAASPALESLRKKGFEVLLLSEPIDEMTLQNIEKFQEKPIVDAGKEIVKDLTEEERAEKQDKNEDSEDFRRWLKVTLGNKITRVEASARLVESPAMIVQSEYGVSPNMQKYLRAQAVAEDDDKGQFAQIFNQAVLEINLGHPIIKGLRTMYEEEPNSAEARERVNLLFNTAALSGGYVLDNSAEYAQMVVNLLTKTAIK